jgi:type I restriction enzyme S subunit
MSPSVQETIRRHTTGVTILHASAAVSHIRVSVPPLPEQNRIVRVLNEAEQLCRLRSQAESRLQQAIPAAFYQLFGDPTTNSKGLLTAKLGDIAKLERGRFTPRPRNDPAYYGGPYPFIQTGDISASDGFLSRWQQTLNERGKAVSREFPAGTVVFAIVGATIGATAILQVPVYCPDSIIGIQVDAVHAVAEYVEHVLRTRRSLLLSQAPDAARANLNLEIVRSLDIPLAPLEDQRRFRGLVLGFRGLSESQAASRERSDELFQALLHRAFAGEL